MFGTAARGWYFWTFGYKHHDHVHTITDMLSTLTLMSQNTAPRCPPRGASKRGTVVPLLGPPYIMAASASATAHTRARSRRAQSCPT
jgi:hypothetical protein